jgi:hypothetical protein
MPPVAARTELVDHADDLVAGRDQWTAREKVALGQMEIGPAHPAHPHAQPDLAGAGVGDRSVDPHQRVAVDRAGPVDRPCLHDDSHHEPAYDHQARAVQRWTRSMAVDEEKPMPGRSIGAPTSPHDASTRYRQATGDATVRRRPQDDPT